MMLTVTEEPVAGFERVCSFSDDTGFQCFIAIHNTALGPALGGCRVMPYASRGDAIDDVLRLAKGMTYKSSLAGLDLGGGKAVVIADRPTREIMLKVGEAVNYIGGSYVTAEDVGTTLADIQVVGEVSPHVVRLDGSSNTALGVLSAMKAAVKHNRQWDIRGDGDLSGVPIWLQGLGKVGYDLFQRLLAENRSMNLWVSDLRPGIVQRAINLGALGAIDKTQKAFMAIYAPCAMGQVVNVQNIDEISFPIICGAANNQLESDDYAEVLKARDVLYCPDWLVNAGGVIAAAGEFEGWSDVQVAEKCEAIGETLRTVLETADADDVTPLVAAKRLAEDRLF